MNKFDEPLRNKETLSKINNSIRADSDKQQNDDQIRKQVQYIIEEL